MSIVAATVAQETESADTSWTTKAVANINVSQVSLNNWAAGGQSTVAVSGLARFTADYASGRTLWTNSLDLAYGLIRNDGGPWLKSDDRIELNSAFGYETIDDWYYTVMLNFRTQFAPGYNYPNDSISISNFLAPGYLTIGTGMDYVPSDKFSLLMAPVTGKVTFVMDQELADAGAFGVDDAFNEMGVFMPGTGSNVRFEFGGFVKLRFRTELMENINFTTELDLFSNYLNNPQNIDVNWTTLTAMKVNDWITVSLSTHLIYDHDIDIQVDTDGDDLPDRTGPRTQFKEVLAVGLSFTF